MSPTCMTILQMSQVPLEPIHRIKSPAVQSIARPVSSQVVTNSLPALPTASGVNQVELDRKCPTELLGRNTFPVEGNVIVLAKGHHGMCSQEQYDTAHEGDYSGTKSRLPLTEWQSYAGSKEQFSGFAGFTGRWMRDKVNPRRREPDPLCHRPGRLPGRLAPTLRPRLDELWRRFATFKTSLKCDVSPRENHGVIALATF
jgi:hypothetical protein